MWSNGGTVFDKNFNIVFNSPQNAETLRFYKELSKYSPPGSSEYSYEQTMNTFITGKAAITHYFGRILSETYKRNPDLVDKMGAFMIKRKEYVQRNGLGMLGILKGSKNAAEAKKFLRYYITSPDLVDVLLCVPGQYMPVLKSMSNSARFLSEPLFKKHPDLFEVIKIATRGGRNLAYEHPGFPNPYADAIEVSQVDRGHSSKSTGERRNTRAGIGLGPKRDGEDCGGDEERSRNRKKHLLNSQSVINNTKLLKKGGLK